MKEKIKILESDSEEYLTETEQTKVFKKGHKYLIAFDMYSSANDSHHLMTLVIEAEEDADTLDAESAILDHLNGYAPRWCNPVIISWQELI